MTTQRLQKILASAGISSRRAAEELITAGRVRVNGKVVRELGVKADGRRDKITLDGKTLVRERHVYFLMHKPRGYVTTVSDPEGRPTVMDIVKEVPERVFPVGRLDWNTAGALLLTNDGDLAQALMHPKRKVLKTYAVKVQGHLTDQTLEQWRKGIDLEDGTTAPAEVWTLSEGPAVTWMRVGIREGRNRQIHRMGEATGHPVLRLTRTDFAGLNVDDLRPGEYRPLTSGEIDDLRQEHLLGLIRAPGKPVPVKPDPRPMRMDSAPTRVPRRSPDRPLATDRPTRVAPGAPTFEERTTRFEGKTVRPGPRPTQRYEGRDPMREGRGPVAARPAARGDRAARGPSRDDRGTRPERGTPGRGDRPAPRAEGRPRPEVRGAIRDERRPAPRDARGPARDERRPPPRHARGPVRDERPAPRDARGPIRDERRPAPRDARGPIREDRRPGIRDERRPARPEGRAPIRDDRGPRTEGRAPARDDRGPRTEGRAPARDDHRARPEGRGAARDDRRPPARGARTEGRPPARADRRPPARDDRRPRTEGRTPARDERDRRAGGPAPRSDERSSKAPRYPALKDVRKPTDDRPPRKGTKIDGRSRDAGPPRRARDSDRKPPRRR